MAKDIDGKTIKVGDVVGFKRDIEQCGTVVKITQDFMGRPLLTLESWNGFDGDYIGGNQFTVELASDCWLE